MGQSDPVGVGVIGLGVMGGTQIDAYGAANVAGHACRLVAVCDRNADRRQGRLPLQGNIDLANGGDRRFDPDRVRAYEDPNQLLADEDVELVSICTHTDTHADLAIAALKAKKHVLVEKPLAVMTNDVERVAEVASSSTTICAPAFCMRYWPAWSWLKARIDDRRFGRVRSAMFQRLASPPAWSPAFYRDVKRTGGALSDLHIHDVDFVRWCFGDPDDVRSTGTHDHVTTLYRYGAGPDHVVAEGGWDHAEGFGFRMRYIVNFEEATLDFDIGREAQLEISQGGQSRPVSLPDLTGYDVQARRVVDAVRGRGPALPVTVADALAVARLLDLERQSLSYGW